MPSLAEVGDLLIDHPGAIPADLYCCFLTVQATIVFFYLRHLNDVLLSELPGLSLTWGDNVCH